MSKLGRCKLGYGHAQNGMKATMSRSVTRPMPAVRPVKIHSFVVGQREAGGALAERPNVSM